jgi:hypothetical protein
MFLTSRRCTSMAIKAGVGMSRHHNPNVAGREAAQQALEKAGVDRPDFVFMFASIGYDQHSLVRTVREATGGAPLSGCSAEGTINGDDADESDFSVVVTAISSDELHWTNGIATGLRADPRAVGQQVAQKLQSDLSSSTLGLFVFTDSLAGTTNYFLAELETNLSTDRFLPLWGGMAGDNLAWRQAYQYYDDQVVSDGVAYALLSGEAQSAWAISHSCTPIGSERIVTRCQGNVIYEIDGKPVLEVIKEYIPDRDLIENWYHYYLALALCFKAPEYFEDEEYIAQAMPRINEDDGSVTIQTEVSEGTSVWFSRRDKKKVVSGLDRMARQIKHQLGDAQPKLVFQFDCASRGKSMFRDQEKLKLLRQFRQSVGSEVPWVGFYTFGEIGPVAGHNLRHLYTAVVLALS